MLNSKIQGDNFIYELIEVLYCATYRIARNIGIVKFGG